MKSFCVAVLCCIGQFCRGMSIGGGGGQIIWDKELTLTPPAAENEFIIIDDDNDDGGEQPRSLQRRAADGGGGGGNDDDMLIKSQPLPRISPQQQLRPISLFPSRPSTKRNPVVVSRRWATTTNNVAIATNNNVVIQPFAEEKRMSRSIETNNHNKNASAPLKVKRRRGGKHNSLPLQSNVINKIVDHISSAVRCVLNKI